MSDHDDGIVSAIETDSILKVTSNYRATFIKCSSLEDLQNQLRRVLETTSLALIPPLVSINLYLDSNATFNISGTVKNLVPKPHEGPEAKGIRTESLNDGEDLDLETNTVKQLSMTEVLNATDDPKVRIKLQAVVARQIVTAVRDVDGFGYGVQSDFDSKKNGHRFTFGCHDSIWNKERRRRARGLGKSQEGSGSGSKCGFTCLQAKGAARADVVLRSVHASCLQLRWRNNRPISEDPFQDRCQLCPYGHPSQHRIKAAQARSKRADRLPRFIHTLQLQSPTGRGELGVTKEPKTDVRADGPLVPLTEAAPQVTSQSQGLSKNNQGDTGIREDQPVSRYPSSPLRDTGPLNKTLSGGTLRTRKRQRNSSSDVLIPSDHNRSCLKTLRHTAQDPLNSITSTSTKALERKEDAQRYELHFRGQSDSSGGSVPAAHVSPEDTRQSLTNADKSGYSQPIDPELMSTSELQHMGRPDCLPSPKLPSNSNTPHQEGASKHQAKSSRSAVPPKRRKG